MIDQDPIPRLEPLPTLPVFFKLTGRRVLVAGGGVPTVWKTELLAAAGAQVDVIAPDPCPELQALVAAFGPSAVRLIRRNWSDEDLTGAALAVGGQEADSDAARFRQAAQRAGVPVNVIDKPEFCDFQFGTIVARAPLVIAITTDGAAPVFGQAIRTRIEAVLPQGLRAWAAAAKAWRPAVTARGWDFRRRRRFWEIFADRALHADASNPDDAALQACLDAALDDTRTAESSLTLVGCGNGTPDDLTFEAARILQDADVIYFDPDVEVETVNLGRREARKIPVLTRDGHTLPIDADTKGPARKIWLGTGNPSRCPHWALRRTLLGDDRGVLTIRGLGRCPRCHGTCLGTPGHHHDRGSPTRPLRREP